MDQNYYGPPIPPPNHSHRRRRCGCCKIFFFTLLGLIVLIGILVLVVWLVVRPEGIKFQMDSATLSYYNRKPSYQLDQYDNFKLSTTFSIRNPNRKMHVYYDITLLVSNNSGEMWYFNDTTALPTNVHQGTKNTTVFPPVAFLPVNPDVTIVDDRKNKTDFANIHMDLHGRIRFKVGSVKIKRIPLKINCDLLVPVEIDGLLSSTGNFNPTHCKVKYN